MHPGSAFFVAFIKKLNDIDPDYRYRLPTDAEWEYAARAGTDTKFSFGNDEEQLSQYGWYLKNSGDRTHPVGLKKPNSWGLYDMHGNVYEFCHDVSDEYGHEYNSRVPVIDPKLKENADQYVLSGGSYGHRHYDLWSANRCRAIVTSKGVKTTGFRLVLVPADRSS